MGSGDKKHPPLSGEDAELWSRVAAQAEPLPALRRARHVEARRLRSPKTDAHKAEMLGLAPKSANAAKSPTKLQARSMPKKFPMPDTSLDPKSKRRLARGTIAINARIDLHGLTAARARTRLTRFLTTAAQARNKWVLVITGKVNDLLRYILVQSEQMFFFDF